MFQTNLLVFQQELAQDDRASFSAGYVKTLRGGNNPVEALTARTMIQNILIMALIDSEKSVDLLSDALYQKLGEPNQIRVCNKILMIADNGKVPVKRTTIIQVQLQKFKSEITAEFLVTKNEIMPCLLGMEFLYNFDCVLNPRKTNSFMVKLGKPQLSSSQRRNTNLFLIAEEDQDLPRRCEGFIKYTVVDMQDYKKKQQTEIIVQPIKEFEDRSHFLKAISLSDMGDDVIWVRVLNCTL